MDRSYTLKQLQELYGIGVRTWREYIKKKELRAFDHIHPNAEGHLLLAKTICPKAPESWGCDCTKL